MAVTKVIDIIRRVEYVLQDTGVRWARVELQDWLNEAYNAIVLARPDANSKVGTLTCAEGTRQSLTGTFTDATRLLDITRNLAATSNKKVVRSAVRDTLDDQRPGWHGETNSVNIEFFTYDIDRPTDFFVYPPATTAAQLEVVYAAVPGLHALSEAALDPTSGDTTTILISDMYVSPLVDWVLYRAYSKDAEYAANEARAQAALQSFSATLGQKTQSDAGAVPEG